MGEQDRLPQEPKPPVQNAPHPMTLALQALDQTICAQRIMDSVGTVKIIVLEWDHYPRLDRFVARVKVRDGVRRLEPRADFSLKDEIEGSWAEDLPPDEYGHSTHWR